MSYSADADEAIEQWALARRPAVSEHRWHHRKPAADWHYTKIHWEAEMDLIQENFERRIGFTISLSPREKRKSCSILEPANPHRVNSRSISSLVTRPSRYSSRSSGI